MNFYSSKKKQAPAVIIISIIDIMMVLLLFLMVTTTFKRLPAVKISLPQSKQAEEVTSETLTVVTISKEKPFYYLGKQSVTEDELRSKLASKTTDDPELVLAVRIDENAPFGRFFKVTDIAKEVGIKTITTYTENLKENSP